jgi:hypothetical protein
VGTEDIGATHGLQSLTTGNPRPEVHSAEPVNGTQPAEEEEEEEAEEEEEEGTGITMGVESTAGQVDAPHIAKPWS